MRKNDKSGNTIYLTGEFISPRHKHYLKHRRQPKPYKLWRHYSCDCCSRKLTRRPKHISLCGYCMAKWNRPGKPLAPLYPISKSQLEIEDIKASLRDWPEIELQHERLHLILELIEKLPLREKVVIKCRYGLYDKKVILEDTAKIINVTRERARQIEFKAIRRIQIWVAVSRDSGVTI